MPGKMLYAGGGCSDIAQHAEDILPLKLVDFTASISKDIVNIRWTTSSEKNVNRFEAEKSFDGIHFASISKQTALGVNASKENYLAEDFKPQPGVNYYRLKVISNDNHITYSKMITIRYKR